MEDLKERLKDSDIKYTQPEMKAYFERHNALELLEMVPLEDIRSVRWYIDCGDDDFLFEGNSLVHIAMTGQVINNQ
jgi:hypothetical protein